MQWVYWNYFCMIKVFSIVQINPPKFQRVCLRLFLEGLKVLAVSSVLSVHVVVFCERKSLGLSGPGQRILQWSRLGLVRGGDKLLYSSCEKMQKLLVRCRKNLCFFVVISSSVVLQPGIRYTLMNIITNHQGLMIIRASAGVKECVLLVPETSFFHSFIVCHSFFFVSESVWNIRWFLEWQMYQVFDVVIRCDLRHSDCEFTLA